MYVRHRRTSDYNDYQSINRSINQSEQSPIQSINRSIYPFILQPLNQPPIHSFIQSINRTKTRLASSQIVTWAYGILPLSNQQSKTSGIRFSMPFPRCDGISSLSTVSRCKSSTRTPLSCANSSIEPTHTISSPSPLIHNGIGVPQ